MLNYRLNHTSGGTKKTRSIHVNLAFKLMENQWYSSLILTSFAIKTRNSKIVYNFIMFGGTSKVDCKKKRATQFLHEKEKWQKASNNCHQTVAHRCYDGIFSCFESHWTWFQDHVHIQSETKSHRAPFVTFLSQNSHNFIKIQSKENQ